MENLERISLMEEIEHKFDCMIIKVELDRDCKVDYNDFNKEELLNKYEPVIAFLHNEKRRVLEKISTQYKTKG